MPAPMKSPAHHAVSSALADTMSLTHLAHRWEMSRREVRQLLQSGRLPFEEVEGQLRVPREAVMRYEGSLKSRGQ